ncbi:MAG TPA: geranylgeranyl reductase family protein [Oscillatoriaceae cyanobacterium M7585_C2015_266]|nr:geranylgeranyl reductase family protein [Oscillatoriaceae cyanobacterium M7585_C2015_266]
MVDYDVIVCGAGPAGATAAAAAAGYGLKVALLEKYPLPRHKTCGGGMPMVIENVLRDLAPEAFVESKVRYLRHTWKFGDPYLAPINLPDSQQDICLWMAQRSVFDNALAQRAVKAGAQLYDGVTVRSVEIESDKVVVRGSAKGNESAFVGTARHVIGADGANSIVAQAANLRKNPVMAIAMEIEFPYDWNNSHPDLRPEVAHLEYGAVKRGYAWIFPKGDHLNIGAGLFSPGKKRKRSNVEVRKEIENAIIGYLELFQIPYERERLRFYAHPLPIWQGKEQRHTPDGKILLVGDAAGLINPSFGDGILHAIKSGLIAAECIAKNEPQNYTNYIHAEFAANFDAALTLANIFYQFPGICYRHIVKRETATRTAVRLLFGEVNFTDVISRFVQTVRQVAFG